jgi:hypothetical protein
MSVSQVSSVRGNVLVSDLSDRISQLHADVVTIDGQISTQTIALNGAGIANDPTLISLNATKTTKLNQIAQLQSQLDALTTTNTQSGFIATKASAATVAPSSPVGHITKPDNTLQYNVPSVVDAYYSTRTDFLTAAGFSSDRPGTVASASELWSGSKSSKGMIVAYVPPANTVDYQGGTAPSSSVITAGTNYGFQFMYNPATISMNYSGLPNVDQGYEMSGQDKFVMYGTNVTQSSIGFQLLINRMFDMKYYDSNGRLKSGAQKAYGGKTPSLADQKQIFTMGTMYDVEYLLRTLLGYTLKSFLRAGATADMGYLGARPVELHLGKNLRYLGTVTTLQVDHVIFNEQMVPLFTNVQIGFNRLPDYPLIKTGATTPPTPQLQPPTLYTGEGELPGMDAGDLGIGGLGGGGGKNAYIN